MLPSVTSMTRRLPAAALAFALLAPVVAVPGATKAADAVEAALGSELLGLVNAARLDIGLRRLGADGALTRLASLRAAHMAQAGQLSHSTYGGTVTDAVSGIGLRFTSAGEAVGMVAGTEPAGIARYIFGLWRHSAPHWALLTSATFNYVGVGVSVRPDGAAYAALLVAETADRTPPTAAVTSGRAVNTTVSWTWTGSDALLQTRTAGLCSFDVQYRQTSTAWQLVRARTTARTISLGGRRRGIVHEIRVRARDCAGNLSGWTAAKRVRVR